MTMNTTTNGRSDAKEDTLKVKFGEIRMSNAVDAAVSTAEFENALHQHASGEWEDEFGTPLSVFTVLITASGTTIVLLTEADRSKTLLYSTRPIVAHFQTSETCGSSAFPFLACVLWTDCPGTDQSQP
jgi:hypothetical protein